MNMAFVSLSWILPIIFICVADTHLVTMRCMKNQVAQRGQNSLLQCVLNTSKEVPDLKILRLVWKRSSIDVLEFRDGKINASKGYSFADPLWDNKNTNVSLLISEATVEQEGLYKCVVGTNVGNLIPYFISFSVTAKYTEPEIIFTEENSTDVKGILECKSSGYPKGQLRWLDEDNKEVLNSATMDSEKTKDGLIQLTSRLTLRKRGVSSITCAVFNATDSKEGERTVHTKYLTGELKDSDQESNAPPDQRSAVNIVAPLVVIGSLIVGMLLIMMYRQHCRRASNGEHISQSDVEEGDQEASVLQLND